MSDTTLHGAALITGASTGIGATYADRLARRGHDLILTARDENRLNGVAERLRAAYGVKVEVIRADLTDRADLAWIEKRLRDDASIGVLVNNAGANVSGDFVQTDVDRLEDVIDLNLIAVTRLAHAAGKAFAARGPDAPRGTIVNISSVIGLAPELRTVLYGATKAFVTYLTQGMNVEIGDRVRLQAVLPGATRTEIWDRSGRGLHTLPAEILMDVDDLVDAALAGLDQGELITIPSLPDAGDWQALEAARVKLLPNLSRDKPAARYRLPEPA